MEQRKKGLKIEEKRSRCVLRSLVKSDVRLRDKLETIHAQLRMHVEGLGYILFPDSPSLSSITG